MVAISSKCLANWRKRPLSLIDFLIVFSSCLLWFALGSSVGFGYTMNELQSLESQLQSLADVEEKVSHEKEEVFSSQLTLFGGYKIFYLEINLLKLIYTIYTLYSIYVLYSI